MRVIETYGTYKLNDNEIKELKGKEILSIEKVFEDSILIKFEGDNSEYVFEGQSSSGYGAITVYDITRKVKPKGLNWDAFN